MPVLCVASGVSTGRLQELGSTLHVEGTANIGLEL